MRLLRNREVLRELLLLTGITAALCAVGCGYGGPLLRRAAAGVGAASAAVYLVSARRRYRALADMSQDIDRVLHGLDSQTIAACDEGELAILSSEIRKMTVRLRQAADSQHRERMQLADAMADISHQLRTPLTAINLTLSMLGTGGAAGTGAPGTSAGAAAAGDPYGVAGGDAFEKMSRIDAGAVSFGRSPAGRRTSSGGRSSLWRFLWSCGALPWKRRQERSASPATPPGAPRPWETC